jgi:hypothetical protein
MEVVVALLALLLLAPAEVCAQELDQRIPVKPGGLLQVDLDLGEEIRPERVSLEVRSHDADEVWAVADLSGLGASSIKFRLDHDERVVRLYGRAGGLMSWIFGGPGVSVRVWVPREFSVDLRCTSGPIRIENVSGTIRARTSHASIDVHTADGSLNLRTRSGAVRVTEMLGDVAIRASEGPISLAWVNGNVEARTGRGDIRARHLDGETSLRTDAGEIEIRDIRGRAEAKTEQGAVYASFAAEPAGLLETRRGSVEVLFPDHAGLQLDARTGRGTVEVGAGVKFDGTRGSDHFVGAVNGGGAPLRIYTARGTIRVDRR